jgi:tRNA pseudouridine55 synthase
LTGPWEGLLLVDKPTGPTSHDIVARVRKTTGQRRIGHAGTLDPMASGLLPLVLGRATRLVRFLPHSPKEYVGQLRLGLSTRTDDITGEVLDLHEGPLPSAPEVLRAARKLRGRLLQEPPAVSARKVGGERLYRLSRKGIDVRVEPAEIEVLAFDLEPGERPESYGFTARVSAGTYIRALARDLGRMLGCGGTLAALRRTAVGPMVPDPSLALEPDGPPRPEPLREALIPLERMPLTPPGLRLEVADEARRFLHGGALPAPAGSPAEGPAAVFSPGGTLLGIAEIERGKLAPKVVLPPPES